MGRSDEVVNSFAVQICLSDLGAKILIVTLKPRGERVRHYIIHIKGNAFA
jgi:hypothetical protein